MNWEPHPSRPAARGAQYARLVEAGRGIDLWGQGLNRQIYLGDDDFVERTQRSMSPAASESMARTPGRAIPKAQRSRPLALAHWLKQCESREEALRCAYVHSGISMTALAGELGLTLARVSQLIARAEKAVRALHIDR